MTRLFGPDLARRRLAGVLLTAALLFACDREQGGTGGSGPGEPPPPPPPPPEATACVNGTCTLTVTEVLVEGAPLSPTRSFLAPSERVIVRAKVEGAVGQEKKVRWAVLPANPSTGPAELLTPVEGAEVSFRATSLAGTAGRRSPNPPLEYTVVATLKTPEGSLEAKLPPRRPLRQSERDVLRQEYQDYKTRFQPQPREVSAPPRQRFNTGNYTVIAEARKGGLGELFLKTSQHANALLNNDTQVNPVGRAGLQPTDVVVSPGPPILNVGPLGDTDPQGDDVCAAAGVDGLCNGAILAGRNGIAETRANNRRTRLNVEPLITSAYRNPQRNTAAGSKSPNSLHVAGLALDLDPRSAGVKGRTAAQLMCVLEQAGALAVGNAGKSFTEQGATTFLECNHPQADHVHINFNLP